jgi:GNAT superfamily N-acetyltransferase
MDFKKDNFTISADPQRLDLKTVHGYLTRSYWATGIPLEVVEKSARNSFCFGVYDGEKQIGFARVITDFATTGYLADVFILEEYQGRGLGIWLIECIMNHPDLQGFRKWVLVTKDAHGLYEKFGFRKLAMPENYMEISKPNFYLRRE